MRSFEKHNRMIYAELQKMKADGKILSHRQMKFCEAIEEGRTKLVNGKMVYPDDDITDKLTAK